ncbi:TIGR00730 family protein [Enterococcus canis]|uniref:Cytokinin riboside 5'-monophosphate phosphoribohydrolase n=1 Tax=Enterococcus canis TaxID=214095 RepID=A0A1L8RF86_9ENTE|nr:TIGR00730 family Rossman fold protein [Enterococcus canis]OJG18393.1 TIGR00730 family protein [Enterococcus canis]
MNIVVYCGANPGLDPHFEAAARKLGRWIATAGHRLIFGGGKVGLMGAVADEVLAAGGEVIGIMPSFLHERELAHPHLTELKLVATMDERKQQMLALGDVCLALPGGAGTLEEITEVISWARIGQNDNPCILFNEQNYYAPLAAMYDAMVTQGFLSAEDREKTLFSDSLPEIEAFIATYTPPKTRTYQQEEIR